MGSLNRAIGKVLLVDDERHQLELRALILTMAGFSVLTASGPLEALRVIRKNKDIDIAVVDYEMPIMNGGTLAACLRSKLPQLNIIMYSAALSIPAGDLEKADSLIAKSEGITVLLHHLRSVFAEKAGTRKIKNSLPENDSPESPPSWVAQNPSSPPSFLSINAS